MSASNVVRVMLFAALVGAASPALAQSPAVNKPTPVPTLGASAPVELVEEAGALKINWTTGRLSVAGIGVGGDRGAMNYRRTLATRAATADAYRRLAQGLDVVRVDANTRLKDLAVADDALRARLNDFVKSAKVLETNYWPDGSAEVVLGADLRGPGSLMALVAGAAGAEAAATAAAVPAPAPTKEVVASPVPMRTHYSSLIIDARGLGAQPALLPNLRDAEGKVVAFATKPAVKYLDDGAEMDKATGVNPLKLKASRSEGATRADLVLTPADSRTLKEALLNGKAEGASIVIVL